MSKILVVENDPETLDMITLMLERKGYEVLVARNGIEGVRVACDGNPDLIVTDYRMPQLDGVEMIKELRSMQNCASVPILVVTAESIELAKEAIKAGADRALAKPFTPDVLQAFIEDLLGGSRHISDAETQ